MNVIVHIERLVLDGLAIGRAEAEVVRLEMEQELAGVLTARGLAPDLMSGGAMPLLTAPETIRADAAPAEVGSRIGQAIGGTLGGADD